MKQPPPSTLDIIEYVLVEAARTINRYPHAPHRVFRDKPESLESYHYRLYQLYMQSKYHNEEYHDELCVNYLTACLEDIQRPSMPICYGLAKMALRLTKENKLIFDFPEYDPRKARDPAYASYTRARLEEIEPYLLHEERIREVFGYGVCLNITGLIGELPAVCFPESDEGLFTAPLHDLIPDAADLTQKIIGTFLSDIAYDDEYPASLAFAHTRSQLCLNILKASRISPEQARKSPERVVLPEASKLIGKELIDAYLHSTPLHAIFQTNVPIQIPERAFAAHGAMFAPSGHGKTQALQSLIVNFLKQPDPPALFIIDQHGDMLKKIEELAVWNTTLKDQLIILDCTAAARQSR